MNDEKHSDESAQQAALAVLSRFAESLVEGRLFKRSPAPLWRFSHRATGRAVYAFEVRPQLRELRGDGVYVFSGGFDAKTYVANPDDAPAQDRVFRGFTWARPTTLPGVHWQESLEAISTGIAAMDFSKTLDVNAYKCCFCDRELEDERSRRVGYGPDCAVRLDLPWDPQTTPAAIKARETRNRKALEALEQALVVPDHDGPIYEAMTGARLPDITTVTVKSSLWEPPSFRIDWHRPLKLVVRDGLLAVEGAGKGIWASRGYRLANPLLVLIGRHDAALKGMRSWDDALALGAKVLYRNTPDAEAITAA